jgi:hypothetical protein
MSEKSVTSEMLQEKRTTLVSNHNALKQAIEHHSEKVKEFSNNLIATNGAIQLLDQLLDDSAEDQAEE